MDSQIVRQLRLNPKPLVMLFTDEKPRGALEFDETRWTCIISLMDAASAGRTLVVGPDAHICMMTGRGRCHPKGTAPQLPTYDAEFKYIVLKPLLHHAENDPPPEVVTTLVTVDQLAVLVQLANHGRDGHESVIMPRGTGCQSAYLLPYYETKRDVPRAVVGMTDPWSRRHVPDGMLSFSVPWKMFQEMEGHAAAGVLAQLMPSAN